MVGLFIPGNILTISSNFSLGALMHIIQDCICGTVPGITMDERIGMKFFKVGSIKEFAIVLLFVLALISKVRFF